MNPSPRCRVPGLVLTAPGGVGHPAAGALAAVLDLPLLPAVADAAQDPAPPLAGLAAGGGLLPLGLDPGAWLGPATGTWAEALGAWRQPCLLLVPAEALAGPSAAYRALLAAAGAPLLGLVQLGGPWDAAARSGDGLPWLGWLPLAGPAGSEAPEALAQDAAEEADLARRTLRLLLERRWREQDPA